MIKKLLYRLFAPIASKYLKSSGYTDEDIKTLIKRTAAFKKIGMNRWDATSKAVEFKEKSFYLEK